MISLDRVTKVFARGEPPAVRGLTLDVAEGETVVLVGPSGCGKTTTMRMINRLEEPTSGTITVAGRNVMDQDAVQLRRGIGYVIQSVGLMPHRTVERNIATVPELLGWSHERIRGRVAELAAMFELDSALLRRYPAELSGGQRQRVGIARALAVDPPVMLMDEPFGAVDPLVRERLQEQFLAIQQRLRKTIVFVTHDIDEAIRMADRIAILNQGGVLEQFAPPEEILRAPANEFVERFVGAERGLKRLSLIEVAAVGTEPGPVVAPDATVDDARAAMQRAGGDWTSVVEGGRLLGWVDLTMLEGRRHVREVPPRPFVATVRSHATLRQALDALVTSQARVAVVLGEDDRYEGILSLERISREIVS